MGLRVSQATARPGGNVASAQSLRRLLPASGPFWNPEPHSCQTRHQIQRQVERRERGFRKHPLPVRSPDKERRSLRGCEPGPPQGLSLWSPSSLPTVTLRSRPSCPDGDFWPPVQLTRSPSGAGLRLSAPSQAPEQTDYYRHRLKLSCLRSGRCRLFRGQSQELYRMCRLLHISRPSALSPCCTGRGLRSSEEGRPRKCPLRIQRIRRQCWRAVAHANQGLRRFPPDRRPYRADPPRRSELLS